ncbi:MAG: right-handed parallel beta-helix repeat-containing protein [Candidatus Bipolaricaulota bacterium]|nr:right-handed parallel beta-helix repeat-containing protein [Candidatus Bipolaricaulota bacterium]
MRLFSIVALLALLTLTPSVGAQNCAITVQPGQSIQHAINTVSEGALVCLAAGTFTENVTINKSLSLRGAGSAQTILQGAVRIERDQEIRVALTGWTITGSRFGAALRVAGQAVVTLEDLALTESFAGLLATGSATVAVTNSRFAKNQFDGARAENAARVTLSRVLIAENFDGIVVRDSAQLELRESTLTENRYCGLRVLSGKATGEPNEMRGNGADLCGFAPSSLRKPLATQTDKTQLTVPGDLQNVQEAVDAIAPGGTILLQNGTYNVGLTLWKPVTIRGPATLTADRQLVLSVTAEAQSVIIEGVTITGSRGDGLVLYGQALLQNAQITKNADDGVEISGAAIVQLKNASVLSNGDDGLFVSEKAQVILTSSTVSENRGDGIEARDSTVIKLQNAQVSNNGLRGLDVRITAQLELSESRLVGNKADGLVARDSAQARLDAAQILNNGANGLVVTDKALGVIANSTLSNNASNGLEVSGTATAEVRRTVVQSNGSAEACMRADHVCNGVVIVGDAQVRFIDSAVRANADWGIMAWLRRCGAPFDFFRGAVTFEGTNIIEGNNRSGNHKGNPGTHPFTNLPDGQVCLP